MTEEDVCYCLRPIGIIRTPYRDKVGMPIQGAFAPESRGTVELFDAFAEGLDDCEGFTHLYLIYVFHASEGYALKCVPFRDDTARGVFSCRAPRRPNAIGLTVVKLLGRRGNVLEVAGVDMLDGTPLLDIKPYVPAFDAPPEEVRTGWYVAARDRRVADRRFGD